MLKDGALEFVVMGDQPPIGRIARGGAERLRHWLLRGTEEGVVHPGLHRAVIDGVAEAEAFGRGMRGIIPRPDQAQASGRTRFKVPEQVGHDRRPERNEETERGA